MPSLPVTPDPNARLPPSQQAPAALVTVAVVSWNTSALLEKCLLALQGDVDEGLVDVWVVDNASTDGSAQLVRDRFPWVKLISSEQNLGFGAAVNLVANQTESPWLAAANADTQVTAGAVRTLLYHARRHTDAAILAPRLVLPDGSNQHSAYPFPFIIFTACYILGATRISARLARHWSIGTGFEPLVQREVPWAVGAFLLIRRAAWERVGGFDASQWMYAEDLDLGWRVRRAGWSTLYVPDALVHHAESASTAQAWGSGRHDRWHASTYAWLTRRRGLHYAQAVAAINVGGFTARAMLAWLVAAVGSNRGRRARHDALSAARSHLLGFRRSTLRQPPKVEPGCRRSPL